MMDYTRCGTWSISMTTSLILSTPKYGILHLIIHGFWDVKNGKNYECKSITALEKNPVFLMLSKNKNTNIVATKTIAKKITNT